MDSPVVLADIDGVLGHELHWAMLKARGTPTPPHGWVDPACVARLDRLCARTGAVIVVSSSWRLDLPADSGDVAATLARAGLHAAVIGVTPDHTPVLGARDIVHRRWGEIRAWLIAHPGVTRWVVIDDVDLDGADPARFVRTDIAVGLTDDDVERAVRVLGEGPRQDVVRCAHCREPAAWVHAHYQCATPACPLRWAVVATCCDGERAR